ncbi:MAG: cytochrome c3 family protein [Anaerolineales bacterium]
MKHKLLIIALGLVVLFAAGLVLKVDSASAQTNPPPEPGIANEDCLVCHGQPDQQTTLPSGETLYLTVDPVEYTSSSHGLAGYACVQCHTDISEYPHPETEDITRRDVTLRLNESCARCHAEKFDKALDSVHGAALNAGNQEAAVCTDCHGAHNVGPPNQPLSRIPQTCERCHSEIYAAYEQSVHGSGLIGEGNPDVPSCIDCHGVHDVQGPSTSESFHLASPLICAECHADEELMNKYGISTEVFDTYVSDFHGKTVLFEADVPGQETNKPVCIDCHGVHDIRSSDDPESQVMKDNLLTTCQKCHPDATSNFPASWLGHYVPDRNNFPVVYFVDLFYRIFIPVVLGSMTLLVLADGGRRLINRRKERRHA